MKIAQATIERVADLIPTNGIALRDLAAAAGLHITTIRMTHKWLQDAGRAFPVRVGQVDGNGYEVILFACQQTRDAFKAKKDAEAVERKRAKWRERDRIKTAKRKAKEQTPEGKAAKEAAEARRLAKREAEKAAREAKKAKEAEARKAQQAKLRKQSSLDGKKVFKTGTLSPKTPKPSAWDKLAPAIIPEGLEKIELPHQMRHRHHVEPDEVPPLFSSLRPGQYIDNAPRTWVQAATGAA